MDLRWLYSTSNVPKAFVTEKLVVSHQIGLFVRLKMFAY